MTEGQHLVDPVLAEALHLLPRVGGDHLLGQTKANKHVDEERYGQECQDGSGGGVETNIGLAAGAATIQYHTATLCIQ